MCWVRACITSPFFSFAGSEDTMVKRIKQAVYRREAEAQRGKYMTQSHTAGPQQAGLVSSQVFPFRRGSLCSLDFIKAFSHAHRCCLLNIFHMPGSCWDFYLHRSFHLILTTAL